jgi:hypothetical protein
MAARHSLHTVLFGTDTDRRRFAALPLAAFLVTFAAYATGVFTVTGGVVFIPGDAALLALAVCLGLGYRRAGAVLVWLTAYGAFLGFRADHAFMGLSYRSRLEQLVYFLEFEGLTVLAIEGLVVGTIGAAVGYVASLAVETLQEHGVASAE